MAKALYVGRVTFEAAPKVRNLFVGTILCASMLVAKNSEAQTLEWTELPTTDRGCATAIGVGANNVPLVIGCGSTSVDRDIFYLKTESCSPQPCFGSNESWQIITDGTKASTINVGRDGIPWIANKAGQVFSVAANGNGDSYADVVGWRQLTTTVSTCMTSIIGAENNAFEVVGVTPLVGSFPVAYGLTCPTIDQWGDHPIDQWNLNISNTFLGPLWNHTPGWLPMAAPNYGAQQVVLFNGPGPSNPQDVWIRDGRGGLWQYQDGNWQFGGAANQILSTGGQVGFLTDHYMEGWYVAAAFDGTIYKWSDTSETWLSYASAITNQSTLIEQIASSQSMQTTGNGTVGPSDIYGIDSNGHIFTLGPAGSPGQ